MKALFVSASIVLGLAAAASPALAHHSWPVKADRIVTVKGTVVAFAWANPHPMITVDVEANGAHEKWQIGGPSINRMEANGWTKTTLKPGDVITGIGYQYTDGEKIVKLDRVILADGKELRVYAK